MRSWAQKHRQELGRRMSDVGQRRAGDKHSWRSKGGTRWAEEAAGHWDGAQRENLGSEAAAHIWERIVESMPGLWQAPGPKTTPHNTQAFHPAHWQGPIADCSDAPHPRARAQKWHSHVSWTWRAALGAGPVSGKTHPTTISLSQISQPHCLHCKGAPQRSFHHNS